MTSSPSKRPIALVTGATSGFGQAVALRLLRAGWNVIGTGRRAERLQALAESDPDRFHPLPFDISDRGECERAFAELPLELQEVDLLINNAGIALGLEPANEADLDRWEQMIDTNIRGLVVMTRLVTPGMVKRGQGLVVNLSSIAATYPYPGSNVYGGTKAFVTQFSLNLRADLHGSGVRVTSIEPGLCKTEFSLIRFGGDAPSAEAPYANTTYLSADDVAEAIFWVSTLPEHVNINRIELMPISQSFGGFPIHRTNTHSIESESNPHA
jgi:3-hydroxy acid dehydrogenase/malonic semialdehyde reductase